VALSKELQIGKAGEHLVCCDLIMQGYNSFLADQGLPFDVLVESNGKIKRIQIRTTQRLRSYDRAKDIYRFQLRRAKGSKSRIMEIEVDYFAFVALDIKEVAYIPISQMKAKSGKVKQTMDFKSRKIKYEGRVYSNGTVRKPEWGKHFEDYKKFKM